MTMKDRVKELRRVPASELRANPKNWRRHPPSQEAALRGVLEDIGFADAVIARETDDGLELIDGHLRQEVMGDQVVPVLIVDVTEEEADKMLLTYDPLAMMAHADQDQLLNLLRDTQFESKAVNDMLEAVANGERLPMPDLTEPVEDPGPQIDRADELREKWQTERGQVWEVGRHRLMCGDCTLAEAQDLMVNVTVQLMLTDPPYGVDYGELVRSRANQKKGGWSDIKNDALDDDELLSLLTAGLEGFGASVAFVWHPPGARRMLFWQALEAHGWRIAQEIIWVKNALVFGRSDYQWRHEPCLYAKRGEAPIQGDRTQTTVWEIPKQAHAEHPTQKPLELFIIPIKNHTANGAIVVDPFLGSGTTMVAAEQLGRICYGMEIEPKYVAVTLERMSGMGLEPKLVE